MSTNFSSISIGIGFEDSELISYHYFKHENKLVIQISLWNSKIVKMSFFDPIFFVDKGCFSITDFGSDSSNDGTLLEVLSRNYENIPEEYPYKLFQFMDLDTFPVLEIVSADFSFIFESEK